jgi:DNA-binding NarL/FixJ family response regulator
VASARPDVAITDVRMPPTNTLEGLEAAEKIRSEHPGVAVLLLSQHLESRYARRLMATGRGSVGYLLKERVGDVEEFAELVRRVAAGDTVMDPAIAGSSSETAPA